MRQEKQHFHCTFIPGFARAALTIFLNDSYRPSGDSETRILPTICRDLASDHRGAKFSKCHKLFL